MAHNVETAFYAKEPAWHGLGTVVAETQSSAEALKLAGLDWEVKPVPIYIKKGNGYSEVAERVANVRMKDREVLGIVSPYYKLVQNTEAFSFVDMLLGSKDVPVHFESAGSLDHGRRIWLLAHLPSRSILGDEVVPYLVFANGHDGKMAVQVALTPTRVVCQNTLTLALNGAKRSWSATHMGDVKGKQYDAAMTLRLSTQYMDGFEAKAELMQQAKITKKMLNDIIEEIFPMKEDATNRATLNTNRMRNQFIDVFTEAASNDLKQFKGDAWGLYNAFGDFTTHIQPLKYSKNFKEKHFQSMVYGNRILEKAESVIMKFAGVQEVVA